MPDPEMVSRAHRAAATLEQAWERWRVRHGLVAHPMPPVSSYVGYSIEEPWGRPRVVFGVDAHEAEVLAALLDSHEYATARTSMDQAAIDGRDMPNDQEVAAGQPAWAGQGDPRDAECAPGEVRRRIPAQVQSPESVTGRGLPGGGERGATFAHAPARGAGARQPAAVAEAMPRAVKIGALASGAIVVQQLLSRHKPSPSFIGRSELGMVLTDRAELAELLGRAAAAGISAQLNAIPFTGFRADLHSTSR